MLIDVDGSLPSLEEFLRR